MRGRPMMYGKVTVTRKCCKAIPGKWKITFKSLQPDKSVKTPQQLQQKQQKWWWKEGSASCLMCSLLGKVPLAAVEVWRTERTPSIGLVLIYSTPAPEPVADELWMGAVWKKKSCENLWGVRRWGLHLVATGPVPHFLIKELCCACLISPFLLLLLFANRNICLIWIQWRAAGPTCGGRGPDPQVSWLQAMHSRGGRPLRAYESIFYFL